MHTGRLPMMNKEERDAQIVVMFKQGHSIESIASKFGLSAKSIMNILSKETDRYRRTALKSAKDFGYGDTVIANIMAAKDDAEIETIMRKARIEKFG